MSQTVLKRMGEEASDIYSADAPLNLIEKGARIGSLSTEHGFLPLTALGYHVRVRSLSLHTEISQTFYNPYDVPMEATYIFPLEAGVAVTDCHLLVGDRKIRADLQERSVARRRYRQAINAGHRAALLEENRSETFSLKVGNIAAGEAVQIRLVTVGKLPIVDSEWTLRLPLVVAPRYTSGVALPSIPDHPSADTILACGTHDPTDEVPDATYVTPPVLVSGFRNRILLSIEVDLDLKELRPEEDWASHLRSSLHTVMLDDQVESCRVKLLHHEAVNRDFILRGKVAATDVELASRMSPPTEAARGTFAIDVVPPPRSENDSSQGRRIVFLLDRSGSMSGWKFRAAQRGMANLIQSLGPQDEFEVIAFESGLTFFNDNCMAAATDQTIFAATRWLSRLNEAGGTEMAQALDAALNILLTDAQRSETAPVTSSIVLITDGQITGEDHLLARLQNLSQKQRPRIYTLGVDRAVNASVLKRISNATNGTFELVESEQRLSERLEAFAKEIGSPVLTDIEVTTDADEDCEIVLETTDLYSGRTVSIYGRSAKPNMTVNLSAKLMDGSDWRKSVDVAANGCPSEDLISLWGRQQVRYLEDQYAIKNIDDEDLRQRIVDVSLSAHVLSRFTAYVAVDESEIVEGGPLNRVSQPSEHPEGWEDLRIPRIAAEDRINVESQQAARAAYGGGSPSRIPSDQQQKVCRLLVRKGILSQEQFEDAKSRSNDTCADTAVVLGYLSEEELIKAIAETASLPFLVLGSTELPESAVELIPESVARENGVIPVGVEDGTLVLATSNPFDLEMEEKLGFILNRDVRWVSSARSDINAAINRYYGQVEGESADSILQEFTDTAIDFPESADDMSYPCDDDFEVVSDGDCVIFTGDTEIFKADKSQSQVAGAPQSGKTPRLLGGNMPAPAHPTIERLVDLVFAEIAELKGSQVRLQCLEEGVLIEYGIPQDSIVEFQVRDRLPRQQWQLLLEAIKRRCQFENNQEEGCLIGTLIWNSNRGQQLTFAVQVDETKGFIELTIKPN